MSDSPAIRFSGRGRVMRIKGPLLAALASVAVASGCASRPGAGVVSLSTTVPATSALILPAPGTQSIVSVVQRQYTNGIEQQIALSTSASTPGQNFLSIQVFGPAERSAMPGGTLSYQPVRHSAIQAEIRRYFPGRSLQISSNFVRNNYGPFGYAFGQGSGRDGCLYGWQQIRSDAVERRLFENQGMIQVRLRVCEAGASQKDLLDLMYGYTITGGFAGAAWNPYGTRAAVDRHVGGGEPLRVALDEGRQRAVPVTSGRRLVTSDRVRRAESTTPQRRSAADDVGDDAVNVPSPTRTVSSTEDVVVPSPACLAGDPAASGCD